MEVAEHLGYLTVGLKVDPDDWQAKVTPDEMVNVVVKQATNPRSGEARGGYSPS